MEVSGCFGGGARGGSEGVEREVFVMSFVREKVLVVSGCGLID